MFFFLLKNRTLKQEAVPSATQITWGKGRVSTFPPTEPRCAHPSRQRAVASSWDSKQPPNCQVKGMRQQALYVPSPSKHPVTPMKSSAVQFKKQLTPKKCSERACKNIFPAEDSGYCLGWNRDWEGRGGLTFYIWQISELVVFSIVSIYDKVF